jgi:hypothetical protein
LSGVWQSTSKGDVRDSACLVSLYEEDSDVGGAHAKRTTRACRDRPREGGAVRLEVTLKPDRHMIGTDQAQAERALGSRASENASCRARGTITEGNGDALRSLCHGAYPKR